LKCNDVNQGVTLTRCAYSYQTAQQVSNTTFPGTALARLISNPESTAVLDL